VVTTTTRELTLDERKALQAAARDLAGAARSVVWAGPWFGLLGGAGTSWLAARVGLGQLAPYLIGGGLLIGIAVGLYWRRTQRAIPEMAQPYERDLSGNRTEILDADVTQGVLVEELEDEGVGYLLAVEPTRTLFLQGQYLYDLGEKGEGLKSHVTVARAPSSRHLLDFTTTGESVAVVEVLPANKGYPLPEDGAVLDEPLPDVVSRLKRSVSQPKQRKRK